MLQGNPICCCCAAVIGTGYCHSPLVRMLRILSNTCYPTFLEVSEQSLLSLAMLFSQVVGPVETSDIVNFGMLILRLTV